MALTDREQEVLSLSQNGYSSSGIAKQLDVKEPTVKDYLRRIENKVGIEPLVEHRNL